MMGLVRTTVSPSSSIMRRSTPWVDGCWGPKLRIMESSPAGSRSMSDEPGTWLSGRRSTAPTSRPSSSGAVRSRRISSWLPSEVSATRPGGMVCSLIGGPVLP